MNLYLVIYDLHFACQSVQNAQVTDFKWVLAQSFEQLCREWTLPRPQIVQTFNLALNKMCCNLLELSNAIANRYNDHMN